MTIHVNIGEAKTRLSELVAAAVRGEEVVLSRAGHPQVRLTPFGRRSEDELAALKARRESAFGMWKGRLTEQEATVPPSMTEEEWEERMDRKFGTAT